MTFFFLFFISLPRTWALHEAAVLCWMLFHACCTILAHCCGRGSLKLKAGFGNRYLISFVEGSWLMSAALCRSAAIWAMSYWNVIRFHIIISRETWNKCFKLKRNMLRSTKLSYKSSWMTCLWNSVEKIKRKQDNKSKKKRIKEKQNV